MEFSFSQIIGLLTQTHMQGTLVNFMVLKFPLNNKDIVNKNKSPHLASISISQKQLLQ